MGKTIDEINEKIQNGSVVVVTASEMTKIVREKGPQQAAQEVDVVTTGTFGAMCSSGVWLNFGHADPPIKIKKTHLNSVEAYSGVAAVDAYLGAAQPSNRYDSDYGGAHVIEDLVRGKPVLLEAEGVETDCYPTSAVTRQITLDDLNQAILSNPRNAYQKYVAATNSSDRAIYTYMGKLLPRKGNITFSGSGELSPICNDPEFSTIGVGTRIFLGGAQGYVTGSGTQHDPEGDFATLSVQGDLKEMSPEFLRGAYLSKYGPSLYVGIGVPIPILNAEIAAKTGISDKDIKTKIIDYSISKRDRPVIQEVDYHELKSGYVGIEGKKIPSAPLSSFRKAKQIAETLKSQIQDGTFLLSKPVHPIAKKSKVKPMASNGANPPVVTKIAGRKGKISLDEERCIDCGLCLSYCKFGALERDENWKVFFDPAHCRNCKLCLDACPQRALVQRGDEY